MSILHWFDVRKSNKNIYNTKDLGNMPFFIALQHSKE